jgi:hypothetical protein
MRIKIKYFLVVILLFSSCGNIYTTVEMIEQKEGLLADLNYRIDTTEGVFELKHRKKQIIDLRGHILRIGSSYNSYKGYKDFTDLNETCYYSSSQKRIVVYFYYHKYGIKIIENLDITLSVEPFENFDGFYTEYFIFEDNLYQAVSLNSEIKIDENVNEFDYKKIKKLNIAQYRKICSIEKKEDNKNGIYSSKPKYIFPEEMDQRYTKK